MKQAGFKDFERGERGSTTQHLTVLDYKLQQDQQRLEQIEKSVTDQSKELEVISKEVDGQQQVRKSQHSLDNLGKKKIFGKVELPEEDYKEVIILAKEALSSRSKIASLKQQLRQITTEFYELKEKFTNLFIGTRNYMEAMQLAPEKLERLLSNIFKNDREARQQQKRGRKSSHNKQR